MWIAYRSCEKFPWRKMFCFLVNLKQKRGWNVAFCGITLFSAADVRKAEKRRCFYWFLFIFCVPTSRAFNIFIRSRDILACLLRHAFSVEKFIMPPFILNNLDHFSCSLTCSLLSWFHGWGLFRRTRVRTPFWASRSNQRLLGVMATRFLW